MTTDRWEGFYLLTAHIVGLGYSYGRGYSMGLVTIIDSDGLLNPLG